MDSLDKYLSDNYELIQEIAFTITRGKKIDSEDLAHEVIIVLYDSDIDKLAHLIETNQMKYYIIRIMLNQYNSNTSPYHYKYRKLIEMHRNARNEIRLWSDDQIEEKLIKESLHTFVEEELSDLPYFERKVIEVYYNHDHSLNSLAEATGISRSTLWKTLKKGRNVIKKNHEKK